MFCKLINACTFSKQYVNTISTLGSFGIKRFIFSSSTYNVTTKQLFLPAATITLETTDTKQSIVSNEQYKGSVRMFSTSNKLLLRRRVQTKEAIRMQQYNKQRQHRKEQKKENSKLRIKTKRDIIHFLKTKNYSRIKETLDIIEKHDVVLNTTFFNYFVHAITSSTPYSKVSNKIDGVFQLMHSKNIKPDLITYNTLLTSLIKAGQAFKAKEILESMRHSDIKPDIITYTLLITGFLEIDDRETVDKLLDMMDVDEINATAPTYNVRINYHLKKNELQEASNIIADMKTRGAPPTIATYTALIEYFIRTSQFTKGMELLIQLEKNGNVQPNIQTYNTCLIALFNRGNIDLVDRVLQIMHHKRVKFDSYTFSIIFNGYAKYNVELEKAAAYVELAKRWKVLFQSVVTFTSAIKLLLKLNKLSAAEDLFYSARHYVKLREQENLSKNHNITTATNNDDNNNTNGQSTVNSTNISTTSNSNSNSNNDNSNLLDNPEIYFTDILQPENANNNTNNNKNNDTASSIDINGIVNRKTVDEKSDLNNLLRLIDDSYESANPSTLINELEANKPDYTYSNKFIKPNVFTYNALLSTYSRIGDRTRLEKLFSEMREDRIIPDMFTYCSMLKFYLNARDVNKATDIVKAVSSNPTTSINRIAPTLFNKYKNLIQRKQKETTNII